MPLDCRHICLCICPVQPAGAAESFGLCWRCAAHVYRLSLRVVILHVNIAPLASLCEDFVRSCHELQAQDFNRAKQQL